MVAKHYFGQNESSQPVSTEFLGPKNNLWLNEAPHSTPTQFLGTNLPQNDTNVKSRRIIGGREYAGVTERQALHLREDLRLAWVVTESLSV